MFAESDIRAGRRTIRIIVERLAATTQKLPRSRNRQTRPYRKLKKYGFRRVADHQPSPPISSLLWLSLNYGSVRRYGITAPFDTVDSTLSTLPLSTAVRA